VLGARRCCGPLARKDAKRRRQGIAGGSVTAWDGSTQPGRRSRDDILSAVRRYLIYGLLAVAWCSLWIMVGLILYLV
jgi:hypothetical protein